MLLYDDDTLSKGTSYIYQDPNDKKEDDLKNSSLV